MKGDKLQRLLTEYHSFCIELIKKIPLDQMPDDGLIQTAFKYRDELEKSILELQILCKENGKYYESSEIQRLKKELENKE